MDGQRSERNNFSLDGITLIEPFAYSLTVSPSTDAIREFRVVENSYSADQGLVSGAQVNIVTRSGSNRFSGTAYEFLRNSAFDAKNFFDDPTLPIPPFRQNQGGRGLGGPLIRARQRTFLPNTRASGFTKVSRIQHYYPLQSEREGNFNGINPATGQALPRDHQSLDRPAFSWQSDFPGGYGPSDARDSGSGSLAQPSQCCDRGGQQH